ncbi:hypothetical protein FO519_003212 [Halicephalobus sp. NKZ332]|nr:hypothetical protein FO519_003212 [Halicephalobus sp. NKZ332]
MEDIFQPYDLIATKSVRDLLTTVHGPRIAAETMTDLVPQIRKGLNSRSFEKRTAMLDLIEQIARLNGCGRLLVPFYRQLLPPFRKTKQVVVSTDISQTASDKYWDRAERTLGVLEKYGGPNASINIKYIIPQFQSSVE